MRFRLIGVPSLRPSDTLTSTPTAANIVVLWNRDPMIPSYISAWGKRISIRCSSAKQNRPTDMPLN